MSSTTALRFSRNFLRTFRTVASLRASIAPVSSHASSQSMLKPQPADWSRHIKRTGQIAVIFGTFYTTVLTWPLWAKKLLNGSM